MWHSTHSAVLRGGPSRWQAGESEVIGKRVGCVVRGGALEHCCHCHCCCWYGGCLSGCDAGGWMCWSGCPAGRKQDETSVQIKALMHKGIAGKHRVGAETKVIGPTLKNTPAAAAAPPDPAAPQEKPQGPETRHPVDKTEKAATCVCCVSKQGELECQIKDVICSLFEAGLRQGEMAGICVRLLSHTTHHASPSCSVDSPQGAMASAATASAPTPPSARLAACTNKESGTA